MRTWSTKNGFKVTRILSGRSNVFLVTKDNVNILVDTSSKNYRRVLNKRLKRLGINQLDYLILTHTHIDHASNADQLKKTFGARIIVQREEAGYLASGKNIMIRGTNLFTRSLVNLLKQLNPFITYPPCPYDIVVDTRLDLKMDSINLHLLHTPGHTPGSMSIIVDDEIALVGDAMFGVFKGSIFPPFALDVRQMIQSWGKLLQTNCYLFMPSHGSVNKKELVQKEYKKWSKILK